MVRSVSIGSMSLRYLKRNSSGLVSPNHAVFRSVEDRPLILVVIIRRPCIDGEKRLDRKHVVALSQAQLLRIGFAQPRRLPICRRSTPYPRRDNTATLHRW